MKNLFVFLILIVAICISSFCFAGRPAEAKEPKKSNDATKNFESKQGDKFKNSLGMEFVYIEPGKFMMGSKKSAEELTKKYNGLPRSFEAEKQHEAKLTKGFYI